MLKTSFGLLSALCLVAGCAAPQPTATSSAATGSSATGSSSAGSSAARSSGTVASSSVDTPMKDDQEYETVFVPPPVGSLLGGGTVRVPKKSTGNDEQAVLGNIRHLNAAAGAQDERPFVVSAVSKVTGVSEKNLQAQQDSLRLRFGELCAINAIARGNDTKVREIAGQRAQGRSWTDLAKANGLSIGSVAQVTRNASELTANSFTNNANRQQGGNRKLQDLGVKPQVRPGN